MGVAWGRGDIVGAGTGVVGGVSAGGGGGEGRRGAVEESDPHPGPVFHDLQPANP